MPQDGTKAREGAVQAAPVSARGSRRRHGVVAASCAAFIALMVGVTYASSPLYAMFCALTGFGGATRVAAAAPKGGTGRMMTISFDANVAPGLAWAFAPVSRQMTVEVGESSLAYYTARNLTARETFANATYNVSPPQAGAYFVKMQCFCFNEQTLGPRESADMPVAFYVDPAILEDPDLKTLSTITLSYTFFPAKPVTRTGAVATPQDGQGRQGKPL